MTLARRKKRPQAEGLPPKVRPRPVQKSEQTFTPIHRDFAIREIGCIASKRWAEIRGRRLSVSIPCEKHHLNEGDQAGRKRRGERFTVGLSPWSHRGICACTGAQRDCAVCKEVHGPSLYHHGKEFFATFGSGDELLAYQDELLKQWELGVIG